MYNILNLFLYIKKTYNNYQTINYTKKTILIVFYIGFEMRIYLNNYFCIYFNNLFYYDIDFQDIKDFIDEIFSNKYAICQIKRKIMLIELEKFSDKQKYCNVWTIEIKLK